MKIDRDALSEPAPYVVRVAGNELLAKVRAKFDSLQDAEQADALHDFRVAVRRLRSWLRDFDDELRDTLKQKQVRRLGRIADATRDSRDLEVHIEWVEGFGRRARRQHKAGITWLRTRLTARKARADLALRRSLDDEFNRATTALVKALRRYTVKVDERPHAFARAAAALVRSRGASARDALARVRNIGDRIEGHEARIEAKRLRYLLEPLAECVEGAPAIVEQIAELQDALGALHDAQLFGSDVARALAKVLASSKSEASGDGDDNSDRAPGLLAISRRLRRDEENAFKRIESRWLGDGAQSLWTKIEAVADRLDAIGKEGREVERKYLLTAMPPMHHPARFWRSIRAICRATVSSSGCVECARVTQRNTSERSRLAVASNGTSSRTGRRSMSSTRCGLSRRDVASKSGAIESPTTAMCGSSTSSSIVHSCLPRWRSTAARRSRRRTGSNR